MKVLIAFDSFKGSLTSQRAGQLLEEGIKNTNPDIKCTVISVADGREGSLEMIRNGKQIHTCLLYTSSSGQLFLYTDWLASVPYLHRL